MRVPERPPSSAPTLAFGCMTARPPQPHLAPANIRAECVKVRNKPGHRVVFMQKQEHRPCVNPEPRLLRPCYTNRTSLRTALEQSQSPQQLHDLLGRDKPSSTAWVRDQGLEEVRRAMLHSLMGLTGCEVARMNMRLRYAGDIEALWYLRSDLLDTLTLLRGEAIAQTVLDRITPMFQGQLPLSLRVPQMPHTPRAHL